MATNITTPVLPSSTTTAPDVSEDLRGVSLMSLLGIAVCVGIIVIACTLVLSIRFFIISYRRESCRNIFIRFVKCACIGELCCGSEDTENNVDNTCQESSENSREGEDWAPPRYNEALRMQRLDSTTILGIPPPTYSTLEHKANKGGQDNLAFEYPYSFSRQVSQDSTTRSISVISGMELFENMVYPGVHMAECLRFQGQDAVVVDMTDNNCDIGDGVDTSTPASGHCDSSGGIPLHEPRTLRLNSSSGILDRLPSYDDVILWIKGTNL